MLGIMQGRLLPPTNNRIQCFPRDNWREEFHLAQEVGLDFIEWTHDLQGEEGNPLYSDEGINEINYLSKKYNIKVPAICADYFMECPLIRVSEAELRKNLSVLHKLMVRGSLIGINRIGIPFVDNSKINRPSEIVSIVYMLHNCLNWCLETNVELHLETNLNPEFFTTLLSGITSPYIHVNYDSGNSASFGYKPEEEFLFYGKRVGSFHVKDRILEKGTVPLGTGNVDFQALKKCLKEINYTGDYTLQVARGETGEEASWAKKNLEFIREKLI